jgi:hypothetical protein
MGWPPVIRAIAAAAIAALAAGCFGAGPAPSKPEGATVVFAVPVPETDLRCSSSVYIGSVAIGPTAGYAITLPYSPNDCGGGGSQPATAPVMQFDKTGATPRGTMIGTAVAEGDGTTGPRVTATAAGARWAYATTSASDVTVDPGGLRTDPSPSTTGTAVHPTGLISDGASIYVAGWAPTTGASTTISPRYPCCGMGGDGNTSMYAFTRLPGPTQLAVTPRFACETSYECLAQNAMSLFFLAHDPEPGLIDVGAFPKSGTTADQAARLAQIDPAALGGAVSSFAADDTRVAWTIAPNWSAFQNTVAPPVCQVYVYDLVQQRQDRILSTTSFSCMGVALDHDAVYVAIVDQPADSDCHGCNQPLHGFGIGRIGAAGGFESVALGIADQIGGPRRIFVDGDDLFAVDPLAIARIAKAALDGHQDFTP